MEQRVPFHHQSRQTFSLRTERDLGIRRPIGDRRRPLQQFHLPLSDGKGGACFHPRRHLQQPIEPAVAALMQPRCARLQEVLTIKMAALVAIRGGDCVHKPQLFGPPQRHQGRQRRMQRKKAI